MQNKSKKQVVPALERLRQGDRRAAPGVPTPPAIARIENPRNPYDPNGQTIRPRRRGR